jgi:translation initiation factor 5A
LVVSIAYLDPPIIILEVAVLSKKPVEAGSLKEGNYVIINDEPCRVVSIEKGKTGKHGHAKAHIVAIGIFNDAKKSLVLPVDSKVDVPIIDKRVAQVISVAGNTLMLMDMESYTNFEINKSDVEVADNLEVGNEVEYWDVMGKRKVMRKKS